MGRVGTERMTKQKLGADLGLHGEEMEAEFGLPLTKRMEACQGFTL